MQASDCMRGGGHNPSGHTHTMRLSRLGTLSGSQVLGMANGNARPSQGGPCSPNVGGIWVYIWAKLGL